MNGCGALNRIRFAFESLWRCRFLGVAEPRPRARHRSQPRTRAAMTASWTTSRSLSAWPTLLYFTNAVPAFLKIGEIWCMDFEEIDGPFECLFSRKGHILRDSVRRLFPKSYIREIERLLQYRTCVRETAANLSPRSRSGTTGACCTRSARSSCGSAATRRPSRPSCRAHRRVATARSLLLRRLSKKQKNAYLDFPSSLRLVFRFSKRLKVTTRRVFGVQAT